MSAETERLLEAVRRDATTSALARWRARLTGCATFSRVTETEPERRGEARRATRLAWGKALDLSDRFLCDLVVADRTEGGARLRLARNVSLPARFHFFDDGAGALYVAQIVWRREREVGCRLTSTSCGDSSVARRMRNRYYAI